MCEMAGVLGVWFLVANALNVRKSK